MKTIFRFLKIFAPALALLPNFAFAAPMDWFGSQILAGGMALAVRVILFIYYVLGQMASAIFAFSAALVELAVDLNSRIILSPIVQNGWLIMRDFTNLGIVIALIFIAFATMLNIENYDLKKIIPKLVIIGILINFSLSIAGSLIDGTGIISNFFVYKINGGVTSTGGLSKLTENIGTAFQLESLQKTTTPEAIKNSSFDDFSAGALGLILSLFFVTAFSLLGALVMGMIAALFIVRYIWLILLLVVMPIVWLTFVVPTWNRYWKIWWENFIGQLFYVPISLFFVFISILLVTNYKNDPNSIIQLSQGLNIKNEFFNKNFLIRIQDFAASAGQMVMVMGLMYGSIIFSKSISSMGSVAIVGAFDRAAKYGFNKSKSFAKNTAIGAGRGIKTSVYNTTAKPFLQSNLAQSLANRSAGTPGLRGLGSSLSNAITNQKEAVNSQVTAYQNSYLKNLPSSSAVASYSEGTEIERLAKVSELSSREKGDISAIFAGLKGPALNKKLTSYVDSAKNAGNKAAATALTKFFLRNKTLFDAKTQTTTMNRLLDLNRDLKTDKELLKTSPHLATEFGKNIAEEVKKIKPRDIIELERDAFENNEVITALENSQLSELGKNATPEIKDIIHTQVKTLLAKKDTMTPELQAKLNTLGKIMNTPAWTTTITVAKNPSPQKPNSNNNPGQFTDKGLGI